MEPQLLKKRLKELARLAKNRGVCFYTDFLNLDEQNQFYECEKECSGVSTELWGGFPEAERKMLCFYEEEYGLTPEFPVMSLKIEPLNEKFSEHLTHRDYLGAVLNLGIDRSRIGDIMVKDNGAFLFCHTSVGEYLAEGLDRVKHTSVVCRTGGETPLHYEPSYKGITGSVSSLRLDSILTAAFPGSRSSLSKLIPAKKVFVNGRLAVTGHMELKEGDVVSVRGLGKFIYKGTTGQTRKGRCAITVWLLQ